MGDVSDRKRFCWGRALLPCAEKGADLIQKFVDKELLSKAHVHRIIKGICRSVIQINNKHLLVATRRGGPPRCGFSLRAVRAPGTAMPLFVCLLCIRSVADPEQLTAIWRTIVEGALHLATTKDGVEVGPVP